MKNHYLNFVSEKQIEIAEEDIDISQLGNEEIAGSTVFSMISAGTELNASFLNIFKKGYPKKSGYTVVFRIEHLGKDVPDLKTGDLVFCMARHQSYQVVDYHDVVKIPEEVLPEHALFIRLAGVSLATLSRTGITPGEKVLVTGLGTVGLMAMHAYSNLGYHVIGVDPDPKRRAVAKASGFSEIYDKVPFDKYEKQIALALECSGNESATLDCCNIVRPHGEVSLVGVPWKAYTDMKAFDILNAVFYNYVKLYSGWEMDLPLNDSSFNHISMNNNYRMFLDMIKTGKVDVSDLYEIRHFTEAQEAFEEIYEKRQPKLATIFSYEPKE